MEFEPTQIKRGEVEPDARIPEDQARSLVAQERSPTLMTSDDPGTGGEVRVWTPANWRYWTRFRVTRYVVSLFVLVLAWSSLDPLTRLLGLLAWIPMLIVGVCVAICAAKHPPYLATDATGIAITTWKGTRALRWNEIDALEGDGLVLRGSPWPAVQLDLTGFNDLEREDLRCLIRLKAHLAPLAFNPRRWKRVPELDSTTSRTRTLPPGSLP